VGIQPGFRVLDYGCGPGSYTPPLAELVGESGMVYALDIHPLAVRMVQNVIEKRQLANVETIHSDCDTGLPDSSVDVVILYDALHDLHDRNTVLQELCRVLRPTGVLSLNDHHLKSDELVSEVTGSGLFRLSRKGRRTCTFLKAESGH
jgi:ubiquinone/menaquinone biosynthesis C-methylase UbiE